MSKRKKKPHKFVDAVPENLSCHSCHEVKTEAYSLKWCEHTICESCKRKRLRNNLNTCSCAAVLEEGPEEDTLRLRFSIEDLLIVCPRKCGKTLRLGDRQSHLKDECQWGKVQCQNSGCNHKTRRSEMRSHLEICDKRFVICEGCGKNVKFYELRKHQISMGCVNQKLKQIVVKQIRDSDKELKKYIDTVKQDTFKTMRDERNLEKEYMWKRIERNPGKFSPTLVRHNYTSSSSSSVLKKDGYEGFPSSVWANSPESFRASPILLRSRERQIRSAEPQVCKRCNKTYTARVNHEESCLWHKGPIIKVFGGMCLACGRLDNLQGCEKGYHTS